LAGAKCTTTLTNTTTPQATYSDFALSVPNANPVIADANGVFPVMFVGNTNRYRLKFTTSADVLLYQQDDCGPDTAASLGAAVLAAANTFTVSPQKISAIEPRLILDETDGGADKRLWDIDVNANVLTIRTRTDADGSGKTILTVTRGATTAIASIDIGNATDLPAVTINGATIAASATSAGSFTGTLTGMTAGTTGTMNYTRVGNFIILTARASITGTSNAVTMTMTGLPAAVTPTVIAVAATSYNLSDNTISKKGSAIVDVTGIITFGIHTVTGAYITESGGNFTNAGTKGLISGFTMYYALS
jgi:hypothetical protein